MLKKESNNIDSEIILRARASARVSIYAHTFATRIKGGIFLANRSTALTSENTNLPNTGLRLKAAIAIAMAVLFFGLMNLNAASPAKNETAEKKINVKKEIKSRKFENRMEAIDRVARKKEKLSVEELKAVNAAETNPRAKYRIIQAIGAQGNSDAVISLLDLLKNDTDATVRLSAAQELGNYNQSAGVTEQLIQSLKNDSSEDVRIACARSLAFAKSDAAVNALVEAAENTNPLMRRQAVVSLGRCNTPAAKSAIKKRQTDSDQSVRIAAGGNE